MPSSVEVFKETMNETVERSVLAVVQSGDQMAGLRNVSHAAGSGLEHGQYDADSNWIDYELAGDPVGVKPLGP